MDARMDAKIPDPGLSRRVIGEAQLLNYLKATGLRLGLLLNFGPKAQIRRRVL
jgi:GxxExxY protein